MIEVPPSLEPAVIADWAESSCLFGDRDSVSQPEVEQALEDAGIPDPDVVVSDIWQEITRRHELVDTVHPVMTLKGRLERTMTWSDTSAYTFQLLMASHSFYKSTRIIGVRWNETTKLFERLSTSALERYLEGRAINIGFPRDSGIPRGFRQCLDHLCRELRELRGPVESYNVPTKDDHVDVVAWRPFADMRSGQVIILAQCAAGADWKSKAGEISLDVWKDYINWTASPLTAFAFPFVCLDDFEWRHLSKQSRGLLLDRLRIASMFMAGGDSFSTVQTQLKEWCQEQLVRLPWLGR